MMQQKFMFVSEEYNIENAEPMLNITKVTFKKSAIQKLHTDKPLQHPSPESGAQCFLQYATMSLIQSRCDCGESQLRPISLTFRLVNSGANCANFASSVVQTGVKSRGCEKRIAQLLQRFTD